MGADSTKWPKRNVLSLPLSFLGDNPDGSGVGPPINPEEY